MAKKEQKQYINVFLKAVDKESDVADISVIASTEARDRDREIIKQDGWDISHFLKNPVILFGHDYHSPPIGKAINTKITDKGLEMDIKFASKEANPLAPQIMNLIKEGILSAVSVGFIPKERDENDFSIITKAELLELSIVPVPSNPEAMTVAMAKGYSKELFTEEKAGHDKPKPRKPKKDSKTPSCRMEGESKKDCVSRKIPELIGEGREQDQAIAIANSVCSEKCADKSVKTERIDVEKTISTVSEKLKEPNGTKEPSLEEGARSNNARNVKVKLPRKVILNLRKETLKAYKQNELVLTLTKDILHKLDEQKNRKGNQKRI